MSDIEIDAETAPLWQLLTTNEIVDEGTLQQAYSIRQETGTPFFKVLIQQGIIEEAALLSLYASYLSTKVVDLKTFNARAGLIDLVPSDVARGHQVIPYEFDGERLGLLAVDPLNYNICEELSYVLNYDVYLLVAKSDNVKIAIDHYYPDLSDDVFEALESLETIEVEEVDAAAGLDEANETSIVKFVDAILKRAVKENASDVHFEPFDDEYRVRCRVDGALYEVESPPLALMPAICSRIKVLSNLNISERRKPQDGRIDYRYRGRAVDMRVSTLPTQHGESICIRILDRENTTLSLDSLGFNDEIRKSIDKMIHRPNGIFIVTGPTGSGKSTTLYACLNEINSISSKLLTAEDPVEYDIEGIIQVAVKEKIGLTYSRVLRSFLRQDPDKIMVGEVRDGETANIAIQAALTGHTVFTTLHTNDAVGAVARLQDMGVKPFLLSASLLGVLAQRLLRRICDDCRISYKPSKKDLEKSGLTEKELQEKPFYYGKGCEKCNFCGYKGRVALHEMFEMSPLIKALVSKGAPSATLKAQALKEGMQTMRSHGIMEMLAGNTTLEEVTKYT